MEEESSYGKAGEIIGAKNECATIMRKEKMRKQGYNCGNELNLLDDVLDREATLVDAVREIKHGAVIIARVPVL